MKFKINNKGVNGKIIVLGQMILLTLVLFGVYFLYPRIDADVKGDVVRFNSINANVIIISENPDFSNPRYLEVNDNLTLNLKPGTYYWKASNSLIQGLKKKIVIDSKLGLRVDRSNETELVNEGNVRVNISRNKEGVLVGRIILEPNQSEEIEDKGLYTGRQE